ncbi:MAG: hypothetical protein EZS28_021229 [Streblomastix strix]|uniref:Uncharacterized protein n=1 Tax=Streblomastix strix TaxID=222440 RepID=A0A5J4VKS9_9EUKA|nr:MAG: hypothetical protein EZS28_021229 [Streblomastix strix]
MIVDNQYLIRLPPASDELSLVDGTASAGISTSYSRGDHIHPQQLNYDNDITATKFIKAGGTNQQVLLANGYTTTIDSKISRTYSSGSGGYIRLCVFPARTSTGAPYIQFQVTCNTNSIQTIDLVPNYSVNGIFALYGVFTASSYVQTIYNIYYGADQLLHTHTGTYSSAVYTAWIHMMSGGGNVTVTVSKQSAYWPTRVTDILTQDIVSSISGSQTQIPISFNLGDGGIISNMLQVNPTDRNYAYYNNGIRIGNNNGDSTASLYLGCIKTATNTTQSEQWEISKTCDKALTINPSSLRQADHSVGLRISHSSNGSCSGIFLGCDSNSTAGTIPYQWCIVNTPTGELRIGVDDQIPQSNKGLIISADGNILTFNGSVIAGTGATSGATNGSVNYSAGNPILWGLNSVDTNGGFYSDGPKIYWRAKPVTLGAVTP